MHRSKQIEKLLGFDIAVKNKYYEKGCIFDLKNMTYNA